MGYLINKMLHKRCLLCIQTNKVFFKKENQHECFTCPQTVQTCWRRVHWLGYELSFKWNNSPSCLTSLQRNISTFIPSTLQTPRTQRHQWCFLWYAVQRNRKRDIHHIVFFLFIRFYVWIWPCGLNMHFGVTVLTEHRFLILCSSKTKISKCVATAPGFCVL